MWLGADPDEGSKLFRSGTEVSSIPELVLKRGEWIFVDLRKEQSNLYLYLDGQLLYTYLNYLPVMGTHVGLLCRDGAFDLEELRVSVGNLSLKVDCLAIPDAFLEAKIYDRALSEYRRIAHSFPDRTEGREAQFRAGITLLEEGRFDEALEEFEELHKTPAAPLEYLGKSLVYFAMQEREDEVNSLELALRRYPHHPMLPTLCEHIRVRLFETGRFERTTAYRYALLIAHQLPPLLDLPDTAIHMARLQKHWEPLPFLLPIPERAKRPDIDRLLVAIPLAFWLAKPYTLVELFDEVAADPEPPPRALTNIAMSLIQLGAYQLAEKKLDEIDDRGLLRIAILAYRETPAAAATALFSRAKNHDSALYLQVVLFLMDRALVSGQPDLVHSIVDRLEEDLLSSPSDQVALDARRIWAHLLNREWEAAAALFSRYPLELIDEETTPLRSLFGCWLAVTEGPELAHVHFRGVLEKRYPRSCALLSHFVLRPLDGWEEEAFLFERRSLYQQLALYFHCLGEREQETHYRNLERREYLDVPE